MAVDDVYLCEIFFTHQKNPNLWSAFFEVTTSAEPATLDVIELNTAFFGSFPTAVKTWSDDTVIFHCTKTSLVRRGDLSDTSIPLPSLSTLADAQGLRVSTEALPGQCSMVVQTLVSTEEVKPRTRGRDFITGLVEGDQSDGLWSQTAADLVLNEYNTVMLGTVDGVGTGRYLYGNWSRTQHAENINKDFVGNGGIVPDPDTFGDPAFNAVTAVRAQQLVRTQRLRQPEDPCLELLEDET